MPDIDYKEIIKELKTETEKYQQHLLDALLKERHPDLKKRFDKIKFPLNLPKNHRIGDLAEYVQFLDSSEMKIIASTIMTLPAVGRSKDDLVGDHALFSEKKLTDHVYVAGAVEKLKSTIQLLKILNEDQKNKEPSVIVREFSAELKKRKKTLSQRRDSHLETFLKVVATIFAALPLLAMDHKIDFWRPKGKETVRTLEEHLKLTSPKKK